MTAEAGHDDHAKAEHADDHGHDHGAEEAAAAGDGKTAKHHDDQNDDTEGDKH